VGNAVTLSVTVVGNPDPTLQWRKNEMNIAGATNPSYLLPHAQISDSGIYSVVASNGGLPTESAPATIIVSDTVGGSAPTVANSQNPAARVGMPLNYQVVASSAPVIYTATGLPPGVTIAPTTGIIAGTPSAAGQFIVSVVAANAGGAGTGTVTITVSPAVATIAAADGNTVSMVAGETFVYLTTWSAVNPAEEELFRRGLTEYSFKWLSDEPRYYSTFFRDYYKRNIDGSIITNPDGTSAVTGLTPTLFATIAPTKPGSYQFEVDAWGSGLSHAPKIVNLVVTEFPLSGQAVLALPSNTAPQTLKIDRAHWAMRNPNFKYVDSSFFDLNPKPAWDSGNAGSPDITVLVLDTGVQDGNPALHNVIRGNFAGDEDVNPAGLPYPQYIYASNTSAGTADPRYTTGPSYPSEVELIRILQEAHGTKVAGAIAGLYLAAGSTLDKTVVGVAPGVRIASARLFRTDPETGGFLPANSGSIVDAINWGVSVGARISNTSFTISFVAGSVDAAYTDARSSEFGKSLYKLPYATAEIGAGMLHFAASGNDAEANLNNAYPANLPSVVAVGAVTSYAGRPNLSNFGVGLGFVAPGVEVVTGQPTWLPGIAGGDIPSLGFTQAPQQSLTLGGPSVTVAGVDYGTIDVRYAYLGGVAAPLIYGGTGTTTNAAWSGKIVLLDRGTNEEFEKLLNVSRSGGLGCILAHNEPGLHSRLDVIDRNNKIVRDMVPIVHITQADGTTIKAALAAQPGAPASIRRTLKWIDHPNLGTSFSSAYTTGVAALILSQNPKWTASMVEARLQGTAKRAHIWPAGYDIEYGWGVPNAGEALRPGFLRMLNLATRAHVSSGAEGALTMGFVVRGRPGQTKPMLIRAVGPTLALFGVNGALTNPSLSIVRASDGVVVGTNTRWNTAANSSQIRTVSAGLAFALPEGGGDSAFLQDLPAGAYTVAVTGVNAATGTVLAEVYDASGAEPLDIQIVNMSSRTYVIDAAIPVIGGFVVEGTSPRSVLIRAAGPSLPGVSNTLANPRLRLMKRLVGGGAEEVAANDNWGLESNSRAIRGFGAAVGAFPLNDGSQDAAVLRSLAPGAYTIEVTGDAGSSGVVLVEVYPAVD
jgi:hypothetical protein